MAGWNMAWKNAYLPAFLANSRLQYARVLRGRGRPGDDRAAENYFTQAHSSADSLGIRLHLDD
jgi:hypothetical protein